MESKPPKFSKNAQWKSLQIKALELVKTDEEKLWPFLDSLIAARRCPAALIVFLFHLDDSPQKKNLLTRLVRFLREHDYNSPGVYEHECNWVWALGWREKSLSMTVGAYKRWNADRFYFLGLAMAETISEERRDPDQLASRHAGLKSVPKSERPFIGSSGHSIDDSQIAAFASRMVGGKAIRLATCGSAPIVAAVRKGG